MRGIPASLGSLNTSLVAFGERLDDGGNTFQRPLIRVLNDVDHGVAFYAATV
ncbi:hypothetical protein D3C84_1175380 [compost metagenome]